MDISSTVIKSNVQDTGSDGIVSFLSAFESFVALCRIAKIC